MPACFLLDVDWRRRLAPAPVNDTHPRHASWDVVRPHLPRKFPVRRRKTVVSTSFSSAERYELFSDEGHGFTSRGNSIKAYTIITEFLAEHLRAEHKRLTET
jgi:hypothetical protein